MTTLFLAWLLMADVRAETPDAVRAEVTAAVEAWAARWNNGRRDSIVAALWDTDDPEIMYLAGEQPDWMIGAAAIGAYLGPRPNAAPTISDYAVSHIRVRAMADNVALASWELDYQFQRGAVPAMRERLRAAATLREVSNEWKFVTYAESPKSAMTYLRELYEAIVTQAFEAKVDAAKAK